MNELARMSGLTVEYVSGQAFDIIHMVVSGRADLIKRSSPSGEENDAVEALRNKATGK